MKKLHFACLCVWQFICVDVYFGHPLRQLSCCYMHIIVLASKETKTQSLSLSGNIPSIPCFFCIWINIYLKISICHMNSDFETSRWGQWKGCRCHGCGRNLKMVHNPCCVSITTVTCLRQRLSKWGRKRKRCSYWNFVFTVNNNKTWQTRTKIDCHSLWPLRLQLGIALVKRQAHPRHLCLWATLDIVWWDSRWGCRSVTLQQNRVPLFNPTSFIFVFFSTCPCGLNIYGLVKPTRNRELTNISSVKVLSEKS